MANRPVPLSLTLFAVVLTAAVAILGTILFQGRIGTTSNAKPGVTGTPDATVAAADSAQYLFTQSYTGGTISGPNDHNLLVTLHGLRRAVTAFTDRPERQANLLATSDFYQLWDSWFETDPPNGVLSFTPEGSKEPVGIVVRLTDPHYFAATGTVVYHAVKIPKSDQLFPGAQALVTPSDDDPNYHNRTKSFGPGMLFIDDASSFQTSLTGFFGSSASPAIGTALSNVTLTPSLTLGSVKITGYSNGIYTGDLNMTLGAESGETPIAATGTFTWTDSNDWTMTIASASTTGDVSLSGTITDTAGALSGNLAANAVLGSQKTPVTLDLSYDGQGDFTGHGTAGNFTIKNSTFSNVSVSFTTASPSLAIAGTMRTTSANTIGGLTVGTESSTYVFSGSIASGAYSIDIQANLPTGEQGEVTLDGTVGGGLKGSINLTDAVIGGTTYPTLSLTFDTASARLAAAGTMETNLGTFSGSFKIHNKSLTNIAFSADDLVFGPALTIDHISFSALFGTAADPSCGTSGKTSYTGTSNGKMTIKGNDNGSFSNTLVFQCGHFASEEFQVTLSHTTDLGTQSLGGILYFSEVGGTIEPCAVLTNPLNNGCGETVPYITSAITSYGPMFYGSLTYGASVSKHFTYDGLGNTDANVEGTIGVGVAVYVNASNVTKGTVAAGGQLGASMSLKDSLGNKYSGGGSAGAVCSYAFGASDFVCSIAFDARVAATIFGKTYAYHDSFSDSGSY